MIDTMEENREYNDRVQGNAVLEEGLKVTVAMACAWIEAGLMTEREAIKYFCITQTVFDRFRDPAARL